MSHFEPSELSCSSDLPYPKICVERPNAAYGKLMLDNMGGVNSEMSAVSLYIYNHMITAGNSGLSAVFQEIGIVEMRHLNIFGCLALQLGENPRLRAPDGERMAYWSPSYNRYPRDLKGLLLNAMEGEEEAVCKYRLQASQIQDAHIVENLNRIISDEEIHLHLFRKIYEYYFDGGHILSS